MMNPWALSASCLGLALIATLVAIWFNVSTAPVELALGSVPRPLIGSALGVDGLRRLVQCITLLAGARANTLTFLAGRRTLMMAIAPTFSATLVLLGHNYQTIAQLEYSFLARIVIATAVIPNVAAHAFPQPWHILHRNGAVAAPAFVISFFGARVSYEPSAFWPGKRNHYV